MKVLLTGGSGQLGTELCKLREYVAPSRREMDILDQDNVHAFIEALQPDVVVHAAAYTDTSGPDHDDRAANDCWYTNVIGTRNIVREATCPLIFISTESVIHPYNLYTVTKIAAELEVQRYEYGYTTIRTSFRSDPFEYPRAFTDMWTIGDSVSVIAQLIDKMIDHDPVNGHVYLGTGAKTVFNLARRTRPTVEPAHRIDVNPLIPPMRELLDVSLFSV